MSDIRFNITSQIEAYADSHGMLDTSDILIGYSGGADSSFLLFVLSDIAKRRGIRLYAAHVNHMLRGKDADSDEAFCRDTCSRLGIPFFLLKADVRAEAKERGVSEEECARDIRYAYFKKVKAEIENNNSCGSVFIATAHNATDNAETVLFNLIRGSGSRGLSGIPPVRDTHIIRPILKLTKERITELCDILGIKYVTDSTNSECIYTRNKIRHKILPTLRDINPAAISSVSRASELLRSDCDYLDQAAQETYQKLQKPPQVKHLLPLHESILSRVLCIYLEDNGGSFEYTHIESIMTGIKKKTPFSLSLPQKKRLVSDGTFLSLEDEGSKKERAEEWQVRLCEGENILPHGDKIYIFDSEEKIDLVKTQNVYKLFIKATLSGDTINNVFTAHQRRPSDKLKSGGHSIEIKKLISDKKIPIGDRMTIPVIDRDGVPVWVVGIRVASGEGVGEKPLYFLYTKQ